MRAINLVPADARQGSFNGGRSGGAVYGIFVGLLVVLLGASVLALSKKQEAEATQELAALEQSTQSYTRVAAQFASFEKAASEANQRIAQVRGLAAARFDWAGSMRELSRLIPSTTQITKLDASVKAGVAAGGGGSALRAALPTPAISLEGCSASQETVADLMTRLEGLRRATQITLERSTRAEANDESCSVGKAAYTFSIVVFFAQGGSQAAEDIVPGGTTPQVASGTGTPAAPETASATQTEGN